MTGKVKVVTEWSCLVCDAGGVDVPYPDKRAEAHSKATKHSTYLTSTPEGHNRTQVPKLGG